MFVSLYSSTLNNLALSPIDRPVSLLLRHSTRFPIESEADVFNAKLTPEGVDTAEEFGYVLSQLYNPGRIMTSPVERCVDTAKAMMRGAFWRKPVEPDERLSYPKMEKAWQEYLAKPEPSLELPETVVMLLNLMLDHKSSQPGILNIFITHDSVLGCILAYLMNIEIEVATWPDYLEGMALWKDGNSIYSLWRGEKTDISRLLVKNR
jgi:broad specificity phosphatase PhoE